MSCATPSICEPRIGILVASPSGELRRSLLSRVRSEHWQLAEAVSGAHALEQLESAEFELLLLDPALPDLDAAEFQELAQAQFPHLQILLLDRQSGKLQTSSAAPSVLSGQVVELLGDHGESSPGLIAETAAREDEKESCTALPGMIGESAAMQRVYRMAQLVSRRETTVLISGQSGTGKDLVAQAIHMLSPRRANPFVVINCAAIPEALLEAELFGYTKGAFTGAVQSRVGRIHSAHGGTLFLDEIGELPLSLQSKLLRFLEQGELQRLGSSDVFRVDVRVLAATNVQLSKLLAEQKFREDLYYRLAVFPIELPLLRDHLEDLPALASSFLSRFCTHKISLSAGATATLVQHTWPGNVRELRNVIERATIMAGDDHQILPHHILL